MVFLSHIICVRLVCGGDDVLWMTPNLSSLLFSKPSRNIHVTCNKDWFISYIVLCLPNTQQTYNSLSLAFSN